MDVKKAVTEKLHSSRNLTSLRSPDSMIKFDDKSVHRPHQFETYRDK